MISAAPDEDGITRSADIRERVSLNEQKSAVRDALALGASCQLLRRAYRAVSGQERPPISACLHQTTASLSHSTQLRNGSLHDDQLAEKSLIGRPSDFLESLALPKCERTRIR